MEPWAKPSPCWRSVAALLLLLSGLFGVAAPAHAEAGEPSWLQQARTLALDGARTAGGPRVAVQVGALDARLRLAPCDDVQAYLPPNTRLWGRSRIGLRCLRGPARWNVFLPVTVQVFGPGLVATRALPAGSVIAAGDLAQAEVDLAEEASNALQLPDAALGRTLARPLDAGRSLRLAHLQPRQWFQAGETVQLVAQGSGFSVSGAGQALTAGLEGQPARVRTESGRVLSGLPIGERRLEVAL